MVFIGVTCIPVRLWVWWYKKGGVEAEEAGEAEGMSFSGGANIREVLCAMLARI